MPATRGKDFKLYINTDDPYDDSPTWSEVTNVRDVTRNFEVALADASIRGSEYRLQLPTLKDFSLDGQLVYDPDDSNYDILDAAFHAVPPTGLEFVVLDGDIQTEGSKGVRFQGYLGNFTVNEALEDVGLTDFTIVPGYFPDNLPRRVEVVTPGTVDDVE